MNYHVKYNGLKAGLCPWELWLGSYRVDCFVTKYTATEMSDFMNENLQLKYIPKK